MGILHHINERLAFQSTHQIKKSSNKSVALAASTNELLAQLVAQMRTLNAQIGWQNQRLSALDIDADTATA